MLPPELASIGEPEDRATEYLHYRQFFMIWETLDQVVACQALETPHMDRDTRVAWLDDYTVGRSSGQSCIMICSLSALDDRPLWIRHTTKSLNC